MVLKIFICNKLLLLLLSLEKEGKAAAACFENNIDKKRLPAAAALVAVVVVVTSACGVLVVSIPLSVCFRVHFTTVAVQLLWCKVTVIINLADLIWLTSLSVCLSTGDPLQRPQRW